MWALYGVCKPNTWPKKKSFGSFFSKNTHIQGNISKLGQKNQPRRIPFPLHCFIRAAYVMQRLRSSILLTCTQTHYTHYDYRPGHQSPYSTTMLGTQH